MSLLSWLLVILAGLSLAAMVVSITIASRSAREARSTIFPIVREEETARARRARIVSSVTGVIAAIMAGAFFLSGQLSSVSVPGAQLLAEFGPKVESPATEEEIPVATTETPLPPTEEQLTPPPTQMPTATDEPSASVTLSATATPTPTPVLPPLTPAPPSPSPTLAASATSTSIPPSPTPASSPIPAPTSVQMGPIAFATQIGDRREPIDPTTVFSDTVNQVYASFPYSGMRNGITWTQIWYFNDVEFSRGEETWEWGSDDLSYVFTKPVGAGDYRLELYVNDDLVASGAFTVRGPVAVGGPETRETPETPESTETLESPGTPEIPEGTATAESP
jgi:hypothetical protein